MGDGRNQHAVLVGRLAHPRHVAAEDAKRVNAAFAEARKLPKKRLLVGATLAAVPVPGRALVHVGPSVQVEAVSDHLELPETVALGKRIRDFSPDGDADVHLDERRLVGTPKRHTVARVGERHPLLGTRPQRDLDLGKIRPITGSIARQHGLDGFGTVVPHEDAYIQYLSFPPVLPRHEPAAVRQFLHIDRPRELHVDGARNPRLGVVLPDGRVAPRPPYAVLPRHHDDGVRAGLDELGDVDPLWPRVGRGVRTGLPAVHVEFVGFAYPLEAERDMTALLQRLREFERLPPIEVQILAGVDARLRHTDALPGAGGRGLERGLDKPVVRLALRVRIRLLAAGKGTGLPFAAEVDCLARRGQMVQNRAEAPHLHRLPERIRRGETNTCACEDQRRAEQPLCQMSLSCLPFH